MQDMDAVYRQHFRMVYQYLMSLTHQPDVAEELAQETGISKSALGSYENDNDEYKEINHGSLLKLADFYQVSVDYLLGLTNNRRYENTPIEELHLSDEVVELLKSERFNNRLLCEIISMKNLRNCWQTQKSMWTG